ncbi:MAG: MFS transporter [Fibrobacteria bacterium]|nr:MFS transporter [Fibrobacteria bacterium]
MSSIATHPPLRPRWAPLFTLQFLGVFHDNFLKGLISFLAVRWSTNWDETRVIAWAANMLVIPYLLFSPFSGSLARRFSKVGIVRWAKGAEVFVALLAWSSFFLQDIRLALASVFLMGLQSCLYSPAKMGLINDIGGESRISFGTGIMEMFAFVGSVVGMLGAGLIVGLAGNGVLPWIGLVSIVASVFGFLAALRVQAQEPPAEEVRRTDWNVLGFLWRSWTEANKMKGLNLSVVGVSVFWMIGSLALMNLLVFSKKELGLAELPTSGLQALMAVGIGLGCVAASWISGRQVALGLAPLGALGLAAGLATMAFLPLSPLGFAVVLLSTAFSGGLYKVPIGAWIQSRVEGRALGDALAYLNLANFVLMFLASVVFEHIEPLLGPRGVFAVAAAAALAVSIVTLFRLPGSFARLVVGILVRTVMRVKSVGMENVPVRGGVLLVANHVSLLDALLVEAAVPRTVRFVVLRDLVEKPIIGWFLRMVGVIPVRSGMGRKALEEFAQSCRAELARGRAVCIFAEGAISRHGQMQGFQRGLELALRGIDVPVVPLHLEGVVGRPFSWPAGKLEWRPWRGALRRVHILAGQALPSSATAFQVRQAVADLGVENFRHRFAPDQTLGSVFLSSCRRPGVRTLWTDTTGARLSAPQAMLKANILALHWHGRFLSGERVGILLPATVAGAMANVSLTLAGCIPVNLNFTASREAMEAAVAKAGISTVITSRKFLHKLGIETPARALFLEDVPALLGIGTKIGGILASLLPVALSTRWLARRTPRIEDVATILFSSGSTGIPKGVPLTHRNVLSNLHGIMNLYGLEGRDVIAGTLPFFHAFGFTGTIWLPIAAHCGAAFHPNPTEARVVGDLVETSGASVLVTTPTFLESYLRRVEASKFKSLRHLVTGAEKLSVSLREAVRQEWNVVAREGYGATECSPIVAVNGPDWEGEDIAGTPMRQDGSRHGSVGRPLPGVAVKVVDTVEWDKELASGEEGLVLVRGSNVMESYWENPEATAGAFHRGWYVTMDIGKLDEDGFLHLVDRLARFSKIGGEMVPHVRVEEELQKSSGSVERAFAVVGVPQEGKGERLAVLTTLPESEWDKALGSLKESGLPSLWIPKRTHFQSIEAFPVLGTGKIDLGALKKLALESSRN